jgi:hypothetical protein
MVVDWFGLMWLERLETAGKPGVFVENKNPAGCGSGRGSKGIR